MTLKPFLQAVARGKGRGRTLDFDEARAAMDLMLSGKAEPEVEAALLMVLRYRGETDAEIAGFTAALQDHTPLDGYDLDWPSYAAGRSRGAPLFLLSAKLVAQAGYRVVLHGWNSDQRGVADVRAALPALGIPVSEPGAALSYYPLEQLSPGAFRLLRLRETLGLRSCVNTVLRMWNPARASAQVQGVFHPSYRGLQARAAERLGQKNLTIIKGGGGEFERHPGKDIAVFGLRGGAHIETSAPAIQSATRRLHEVGADLSAPALWAGHLQDDFAVDVVVGTAALALWTLGAAAQIADAEELATELWAKRLSQAEICA
ncbi:MAG: glycosyl transferase family protein [Pseudomonadota bacterium]